MGIVCKFGGTSVADGEAQRRLVAIVRERLDASPLVVVSALAGVSDGLLRVLALAAARDEAGSAAALGALAERHRLLLRDAAAPEAARAEASAAIEATLEELESARRGIALLGEASPGVRARVLAAGELLSSRLVALAFATADVTAAWFDAREVLRTAGGDPEQDQPVPADIRALVTERLGPLLGPGRVVVTQGFVGRDAAGRTTLLGRGGSDYSASLLGAALGAERIEIWTDVDGVLTADPRVVPGARRVTVLSFAEASELAYFGAKVLHPSTVLPAVEAAIPVWVGNARAPGGRGTTILPEGAGVPGGRWVVKAIATKRGITVIRVLSTRMLMAHGFLARIFRIFEERRVPVDVVTTSEVSVSLTVDRPERVPELIAGLGEFAEVEVEEGCALVCLVGDGLRDRAGIAAEVFGALHDVPVRMISQGASAINLTLVLAEDDVDGAVRALHGAFFQGSLPPELFGEAAGAAAADTAPAMPGVPLLELARRHGTPLYVYDLDAIDRRATLLRSAFPPGTRVFYACKANAHPRVLERMAALGIGAECASPGEVERALTCGHAPGAVAMSATNAHPEAIAGIVRRGVTAVLGARSELRRVGALVPGAAVLLRVNPGFGHGHHRHVVTGGTHSKFGIALAEIDEALDEARATGLVVRGLHAHIGSGILEPEPLLAAADRLLAAAQGWPGIEVIDFGGGYGTPYREGEAEFPVAAFGQALAARLDDFARRTGRRLEPWIEPGRWLVAQAGALLAQVTCRKESGGLTFVGLDTGMNHLVRPALYGAYHRIVNLSAPGAPVETVEVVGDVCETTDVFASGRALPRAEEGHVLAILDAGAYGFSMASAYNLWTLPREIALSGGREV